MCSKLEKLQRKEYINAILLIIIIAIIIILLSMSVMEWSGEDRQQSQPKGRPQQAYGNQDLFPAANFQYTQNAHSHAQITRRRGPQGKRFRYNQIGPLDHKMATFVFSPPGPVQFSQQ